MKRIIISILLCSLMVPSSFAQWRIGGKVGINWSTVTDLGSSKVNNRKQIGYNIGFIGDYAFHDRFDIQGEILCSRYGYKIDSYNSIYLKSTETPVLSYYIHIPIILQCYPFSREKNFCIHAGIQPGFSIGEQISFKTDYEKHRKIFDFGLIFGATYHFPQETFLKNCFLEGRYLLGLTDHYKAYPGKMRNRSIQLSFGYLFSVR